MLSVYRQVLPMEDLFATVWQDLLTWLQEYRTWSPSIAPSDWSKNRSVVESEPVSSLLLLVRPDLIELTRQILLVAALGPILLKEDWQGRCSSSYQAHLP